MPERKLREIAKEISAVWKPVSIHAAPWLRAMHDVDNIDDSYGADDGHTIVIYFLSNAQGWRGEDARRIKAELNNMIRNYYIR